MTVHDLEQIFYSGQFMSGACDYDSLKEILYLLEHHIITLTTADIYAKNEYHTIIDDILNNHIAQIDYDGGGVSHQALKVLAERYLHTNNMACDIEVAYASRIPDVISKDKRIIVECGNTDPKKLFDYFEENHDTHLHIIPYPIDTDTVIRLHTFTILNLEHFIRCMNNKRATDYNPLKQLIQNRRNKFEDN